LTEALSWTTPPAIIAAGAHHGATLTSDPRDELFLKSLLARQRGPGVFLDPRYIYAAELVGDLYSVFDFPITVFDDEIQYCRDWARGSGMLALGLSNLWHRQMFLGEPAVIRAPRGVPRSLVQEFTDKATEQLERELGGHEVVGPVVYLES
jgi:hypothetical protein